MSIDEIKNTQKNGSRGKGIVASLQRYEMTKQFILTLSIYRKKLIKA
jgi:hypothetical protein